MFSSVEIQRGSRLTLRFNWAPERVERLIIRNKLTKQEYYNEECTDRIRRNGVMLANNAVFQRIPIEVVSRVRGREDITCSVRDSAMYYIGYTFQRPKRSDEELLIVELVDITEEAGELLPEEMVYLELISPDNFRIPIYLPRLYPGRNIFRIADWRLHGGYRIDKRQLRLNEDAVIDRSGETIRGIFRLVSW